MKISYFVLFIFLISLVGAVDFKVPVNTNIDINWPCFTNGDFCSSSFLCNLTVIRPDQRNLLLDNAGMSHNPTHFNVSVAQAQNRVFGVHKGIMSCNNGTDAGEDTFEYEVTSDGGENRPFPIELSVFILGFALIFLSKVKEELSLFNVIGSVILMVIGVLALYPGFASLNHSTLLGMLIGMGGIGAGFFFLVQDAFSFDRQVQTFEQDDDGRFHD